MTRDCFWVGVLIWVISGFGLNAYAGPRSKVKSRIPLPDDDKRWKIVNATMRRHAYHPSSLIETLHSLQSSFGFLDEIGMRFVADSLVVPTSKVFGVATFYHLFHLKPKGRHSCVVYTGTACFMKGAPQLIKTLKQKAGVEPGQTTPDGAFSLLTARCIGACSLAPVIVTDGETVPRAQQNQVEDLVEGWLHS